jgi:hypothetical protein
MLVVAEHATFREVASVIDRDESTVRQHWRAAVGKHPPLARQRGRVRTERYHDGDERLA